MAKKILVAGALLLLLVAQPMSALPADGPRELALQAEKLLDEGSRLAQADKLAEAAAVFLQAAGIYERLLKDNPGDSSSRQNYLYSLGERGMIYVRKGQPALKEKKFALAADLYAAAVAAYDLALKKLPAEKNFQVNRRYCRHEWGIAQFQAKLATKGPAYAFQLAGLNGAPVNLAALKNKVVVLTFSAGWCPSCRETMPKLAEAQKRFIGKPVQVVVLALDRVEGWKKGSSEEKSLAEAKETGLPFAWADEETFFQYGSPDSIPRIFLIDRSGRIAAQVAYEDREPDRLASRIAALL